ncbi:MAG: S-layer homology domain-containing protein, partial [Clostridia bacterium]|nr:S-layer homology domain-containing protein [Clostridia bacterium]
MKKFLALVLALVMTMSLVTISAGAEGFTDDSKITYEEAVDVVSAAGIVSGYENGSFNPTGTLT